MSKIIPKRRCCATIADKAAQVGLPENRPWPGRSVNLAGLPWALAAAREEFEHCEHEPRRKVMPRWKPAGMRQIPISSIRRIGANRRSPVSAASIYPPRKACLASGFRTEQIMQAGRDVNKLEIDTKQNIARAARLNRDAPSFMPKAHRYKGELDSATKTEGAIAKDEARLAEMEKQGQTNSAEATALREHIARQKQEVEQTRQQAEKQAEEAIKALPEARKDDGREIVKAIREKDMHRRREFGAHTLNEKHEARIERQIKQRAFRRRVEAAHATRVASRQANARRSQRRALMCWKQALRVPSNVQRRRKTHRNPGPSQSGETKTADAEPKQEQPAKPPVRQAAAQPLAAPKV